MTMKKACQTRKDNSAWVDRQTKSDARRLLYERERAAAWALEMLSQAMEKEGLSKADVARALGVSRPYITKILSGDQNLTIKKFADLAWACNTRVRFDLKPLSQAQFVSEPVNLVKRKQTTVHYLWEGDRTTSKRNYHPDLALAG